jgi:DNA processing protein
MALEQDRQVFAVPGSPLTGKTRGSNRLLKEGAKLVECVEDVIEELAPQMIKRPHAEAAPTTSVPQDTQNVESSPLGATLAMANNPELAPDSTTTILKYLTDTERLHVDSIIESSGLNAQTVLRLLLELELEGRITQHPGKLFSLA